MIFFCSHFQIHAAHYVYVKIKSLVQAKNISLKYVDLGTKQSVTNLAS